MKTKFHSQAILLFIIVSCAALAFRHPDTCSISGIVRDKATGEVIVAANVTLTSSNQQIQGAITDDYGNFCFKNITDGTYTITVKYVGFNPYSNKNVVVKDGKSNPLKIELESSTKNLQEVTITSYKAPLAYESISVQSATPGVSYLWSSSKKSAGRSYSGSMRLADVAPARRPDDMDIEPVKGKKHEKPDQKQFNTEEYDKIVENEFQKSTDKPLSTFSIDVDVASYGILRKKLDEKQKPPQESIRLEEMINYFTYDYPDPTDGKPFSVTSEVGECPWNSNHQILEVGIQGKRIAKSSLPPSNLVFLIDVSGSMFEPDKLPLVKQSLRMLINELRAEDKIAIVVYAGNTGLVLPSTPASQKEKIIETLDRLEAGGGTAGAAGIELAYKVAKENLLPNGNNRVILCTDGDFNLGPSSDAALTSMIEKKREDGIFLSVLGFGMGNYKDAKMEKLADKGNGNYAYIDNLQEAKKNLVTQMGGTLLTIAKDVKIQVEFNPAKVKAYRLIGYENRALSDKDFNNDKKDAGEIGAGVSVTALYEIITDENDNELKEIPKTDPLKYQAAKDAKPSIQNSNEMLTVKIRYKEPKENSSKLLEYPVSYSIKKLDQTSENFRFASSVASFGMLLRDSKFKGNFSYDKVIQLAKGAKGKDAEGYRSEFIKLVSTAKGL